MDQLAQRRSRKTALAARPPVIDDVLASTKRWGPYSRRGLWRRAACRARSRICEAQATGLGASPRRYPDRPVSPQLLPGRPASRRWPNATVASGSRSPLVTSGEPAAKAAQYLDPRKSLTRKRRYESRRASRAGSSGQRPQPESAASSPLDLGSCPLFTGLESGRHVSPGGARQERGPPNFSSMSCLCAAGLRIPRFSQPKCPFPTADVQLPPFRVDGRRKLKLRPQPLLCLPTSSSLVRWSHGACLS